ncbi:MAG: membrane or secreted protein, partial [Candidatus Dadabacteria bacterium]
MHLIESRKEVMMYRMILYFGILLTFSSQLLFSQSSNLVYVDQQGILRYTKDNTEASFFGVNYTVPFAYGYRSHNALNVDIEKAIDADVYHMHRLGLDAFRVHMWDVEISDSLGNLLQNDHLRLFDYLLAQLKKNNIRILITPIAFWGNGYPERDEKTPGFSTLYGKGNAVVLEPAIKAQENYLKQIMLHVNPYTRISYKDDPNIIAAEINNEPHHSGPKEKTTEYINRLATAIRSTGWAKPIFYNISESPTYADAVVKTDVQGHSFQWYPTGLVAGHEQKGNFLPNVDEYRIPFADTIPAFRTKAKMVYEFDAADVLQPIMYPAMARTFRTAGFQWATQFAYDPMATAYANTEYQTHYLNLIYTPAKAISLLIASKVFHLVPCLKSYGHYPQDSTFEVFNVSYKQQLCLMNSEEEYYYSNNTSVQPINLPRLNHIAGVGSSPVVKYMGTGAYFLDKVDEGSWLLEVMPDAINYRDPFEKASPRKEVTRIEWNRQDMQLSIPGIGENYSVTDLLNNKTQQVSGSHVLVAPGKYLITRYGYRTSFKNTGTSVYYAPRASTEDPVIVHIPTMEVSAGKPFMIAADITGLNDLSNVNLELRTSTNKWKAIRMISYSRYKYKAEVPVEMVTPGVISYRIIIHRNDETYVFPGGLKGNPYAWDYIGEQTWSTFVTGKSTPLMLFSATADRNSVMVYNPDWRLGAVEYVTTDQPMQLAVRTITRGNAQTMGWQIFFGDRIKGRASELDSFT